MSKKEYEQQFSTVNITTMDGHIITFVMSAGPRLMSYVTEEASRSGFLTLRNDEVGTAISVPTSNIHNIEARLLK